MKFAESDVEDSAVTSEASGLLPFGEVIVYEAPDGSEGVVDIFAAAGLDKPDLSILSDEFFAEMQGMPQRNLAVALRRSHQDPICTIYPHFSVATNSTRPDSRHRTALPIRARQMPSRGGVWVLGPATGATPVEVLPLWRAGMEQVERPPAHREIVMIGVCAGMRLGEIVPLRKATGRTGSIACLPVVRYGFPWENRSRSGIRCAA